LQAPLRSELLQNLLQETLQFERIPGCGVGGFAAVSRGEVVVQSLESAFRWEVQRSDRQRGQVTMDMPK